MDMGVSRRDYLILQCQYQIFAARSAPLAWPLSLGLSVSCFPPYATGYPNKCCQLGQKLLIRIPGQLLGYGNHGSPVYMVCGLRPEQHLPSSVLFLRFLRSLKILICSVGCLPFPASPVTVSALRDLEVTTGGNFMHETGTSPSAGVVETAAAATAAAGGMTLTNTMLSDEATAAEGPLPRCSRISTC